MLYKSVLRLTQCAESEILGGVNSSGTAALRPHTTAFKLPCLLLVVQDKMETQKRKQQRQESSGGKMAPAAVAGTLVS